MMERNAVISPDGLFRYRLTRLWHRDRPTLYVGMLNPSRADAQVDDLTVKKVCGFAERLGCGSALLWNLYAFRSTWPEQLWHVDDPIGPENDRWTEGTMKAAVHDRARFVVAWGALPTPAARTRAAAVLQIALGRYGLNPQCWGMTDEGFPRHPSRIAYTTPLVDYTGHNARQVVQTTGEPA